MGRDNSGLIEGKRAMNIVDRIGKKQMENALAQREIPEFAPGDTVRVDVKVVEGSRERIQAFEGVCIARKSSGGCCTIDAATDNQCVKVISVQFLDITVTQFHSGSN